MAIVPAMGSFQPDPDVISWRMHFRSPPEEVYRAVTTDEGRRSFWAEESDQIEDTIRFVFPGGLAAEARILEADAGRLFTIDYFGAVVTFELEATDDGGTDLCLTTRGFAPDDRDELLAGWLNVLFPLKAWVDHRIDLRNHDPERTWWNGFADQ